MKLDKYRGIIPAFYACYDRAGEVSGDGVRALTRYFVDQGVKASMWAGLRENASTSLWRTGKRRWRL